MILYHATDEANLDSIMQKGLLPSGFDGIYFADNPKSAAFFLALRGIKHIAVLPVCFKKSEVKPSVDHAEHFFRCKAYTYGKPIQSAHILWDKASKWYIDLTKKAGTENAGD